MAGYIGKGQSLANLSETDPTVPSQTGNSGKYLTTDGTNASWGAVDLTTKVSKSGDTMTGALNFGDNVKAQFGASNDLQIYHDSIHSRIQDVGTGNLKLQGTNVSIENGNSSELMIGCTDGGAVSLSYAGSTKLATTSTGVSVTGRVVASEDIRLANTSTWTGEHNGKLQVLNGNLYIQGGASSNNIIFRNASGTNIVNFKENGDVQFNSGYGSAATAYGCRAWVNFNGTGTVAIRDSGNVSSITDNGPGIYTLNFSTSLVDANYAIGGAASHTDHQLSILAIDGTSKVKTTSACKIRLRKNANSTEDASDVSVILLR